MADSSACLLDAYGLKTKTQYYEWIKINHPDRGGQDPNFSKIIELGKLKIDWDVSDSPLPSLPVKEGPLMEKITVHPYDWQVIDAVIPGQTTELRAWCLDKNDKPNLIRILTFDVLAHLELPTHDVYKRKIDWTAGNVDRLVKYINAVLKDGAPKGAKMEMETYLDSEGHRRSRHRFTKLYYYQINRTPFLLLAFYNLKAMMNCKNLFLHPKTLDGIGTNMQFVLHNTNISQPRKLLTIKSVRYSQWFNAVGRQPHRLEKVSTDNIIEYIIDYKTMKALPDEKTISCPLILSFDIEVNSDNPKIFPDAHNSRDIPFMISAVFARANHPEDDRKICVIYGISLPANEGEEFIFVDSETALMRTFEQLIIDIDPDIVTGYNIHGFDYPFLNKRLERLGLKWGCISRIKDEPATFKSTTWSSSGFGHNDINILLMSGRISVDLLPIVKREHKIARYNLDTVAKKFLGDKVGKNDVTPQQMFIICRRMMMLRDILEHMRPRDEFMDELEPGERICIINKLQNTKNIIDWLEKINIFHSVLNPEQFQELIQLCHYVEANFKVVADYCIKDADLVIQLFNKLNIWIMLIQFSNIAGVTPTDLFTRGQQARGLSCVYDIAYKEGYIIDTHMFPKDTFMGGFVGKPVPGLYDNVMCLDFKSLYPNIIRAFNLCWTTFLPTWSYHLLNEKDCNIKKWTEETEVKPKKKTNDNIGSDSDEDEDLEDLYDPDLAVKEEEEDDLEIDSSATSSTTAAPTIAPKKAPAKPPVKTQGRAKKPKVFRTDSYEFRFAKESVKRGLLPIIVKFFIDARAEVVREMKKYPEGSIEYIMLKQRELAIKQIANSLYGLTGCSGEGAALPLPPLAKTTTAYGRELITFTNDYIIDKHNGHIVYNDTDSTMCTIPGIVDGIAALAYGLMLEKEISKIFADTIHPCLYLELEKVGRMFIIAPKNYIFWEVDDDGELKYKDGEPDYMVRGIPLARRDKSGWQREIVRTSINKIATRETYQQFLDYLVEKIVNTLRGLVDWQDFIIIRGLGANYKSPTYFMKIFGEELQKLGRPAQPGERLEYVIVKPVEPQRLVGMRMRDPETYCSRVGTDMYEPIDHEYYIENLLQKCIEKYWRIAFKDIILESMMKTKYEAHNKILRELREMGHGAWVDEALDANDNDVVRAVEGLLISPMKNKTKALRSKYITGRSVFNTNIDDKPIKMILNGHRRGKLEQVVKSLTSVEMYEKLYPQSVGKEFKLNKPALKLNLKFK